MSTIRDLQVLLQESEAMRLTLTHANVLMRQDRDRVAAALREVMAATVDLLRSEFPIPKERGDALAEALKSARSVLPPSPTPASPPQEQP